MFNKSKDYLIFLSIIFIPLLGFSQSDQNQKCTSPEAKQFDFWIGKWKAEWINPDSSKDEGTNEIKKILGGCVIEENFNGGSNTQLIGKSVSVYNSNKKNWQQTWVDNQAGYLDFKGGFENDKMILSREAVTKDGIKFQQRMVFYNIKKNKFDWDWETSKDNGQNWELKWQIHYSRIE